jgi:FkbM family methyltransferase
VIKFKYLIPRNRRAQLRVAIYPGIFWKVFRAVKFRSIGKVLQFFEEFHNKNDGISNVYVRGCSSPVSLRFGTSDFEVFRQVFLERQYELPILNGAEFIIDAGANIGLSSVYFLMKNPQLKVLAIEPDIQNYKIAKNNLIFFADRCDLILGAVWSQSGTLAISRGTFRDGQHWATQTLPVSEFDESDEQVRSYTLNELIDVSGFPHIDLLKMDIEGAELQVFRDGDTTALSDVSCCAVECHDQKCLSAFHQSLEPFDFLLRQQGELEIAERR